jgi:hypothetical protein
MTPSTASAQAGLLNRGTSLKATEFQALRCAWLADSAAILSNLSALDMGE